MTCIASLQLERTALPYTVGCSAGTLVGAIACSMLGSAIPLWMAAIPAAAFLGFILSAASGLSTREREIICLCGAAASFLPLVVACVALALSSIALATGALLATYTLLFGSLGVVLPTALGM